MISAAGACCTGAVDAAVATRRWRCSLIRLRILASWNAAKIRRIINAARENATLSRICASIIGVDYQRTDAGCQRPEIADLVPPIADLCPRSATKATMIFSAAQRGLVVRG